MLDMSLFFLILPKSSNFTVGNNSTVFFWLCWIFTVAGQLSLVAHAGLVAPAACGIIVPQPGIELASPALKGDFLTTGPPGKSLSSFS